MEFTFRIAPLIFVLLLSLVPCTVAFAAFMLAGTGAKASRKAAA